MLSHPDSRHTENHLSHTQQQLMKSGLYHDEHYFLIIHTTYNDLNYFLMWLIRQDYFSVYFLYLYSFTGSLLFVFHVAVISFTSFFFFGLQFLVTLPKPEILSLDQTSMFITQLCLL